MTMPDGQEPLICACGSWAHPIPRTSVRNAAMPQPDASRDDEYKLRALLTSPNETQRREGETLLEARRNAAPQPRYRTGSQVGRTIYSNDLLIGVMDTRAYARLVVDALNATTPVRDVPPVCRRSEACTRDGGHSGVCSHFGARIDPVDGSVWGQGRGRTTNSDAPAHDPVNSPSHYQLLPGVEVIHIIEKLNLGYHLGNVAKYLLRAGRKDGAKRLEDLKKARYYLSRQIELLEGKP